jgi:hypothetical protein
MDKSSAVHISTSRPTVRGAIALATVWLSFLLFWCARAKAQDAPPRSGRWEWSYNDNKQKDGVAKLAPLSGQDHFEIFFFKHEIGSMMIRVSEPIKSKHVLVKFWFDDAKPNEEKWRIVKYPKNEAVPLLDWQDHSVKLFQEAMKHKTLTVSFRDDSGTTVTNVFDLSEMQEQMDDHHVHAHKFGVRDGLTAVLQGGLIG